MTSGPVSFSRPGEAALAEACRIMNDRLPATTSERVQVKLVNEAQAWATIALVEVMQKMLAGNG